MNICTFTGRTTKDVELQQTQSGTVYARFSLANDTGYGDKKKTNFFNMVVWGKSAEAMQKYVTKGMKIAVECEAQQNSYTNKDGNKVNTVDFNVRNWEFCESKNGNQQNDVPNSAGSAPTDDFMTIPDNVEDEGLPFS